MSAGRPTKYNRNMLKRTIEYIDNHDGPIPSVAGLSLELKVSKSTIYLWAQENKEFSDALDQLKSKQEILLMQGGLTNVYNATIAKLIMATNHGYSDKQQTEHTGNVNHTVKHDLSKLTVEELEQLEKLTARTITD